MLGVGIGVLLGALLGDVLGDVLVVTAEVALGVAAGLDVAAVVAVGVPLIDPTGKPSSEVVVELLLSEANGSINRSFAVIIARTATARSNVASLNNGFRCLRKNGLLFNNSSE